MFASSNYLVVAPRLSQTRALYKKLFLVPQSFLTLSSFLRVESQALASRFVSPFCGAPVKLGVGRGKKQQPCLVFVSQHTLRQKSRVGLTRKLQWEEEGVNLKEFAEPASLPPSRLHQPTHEDPNSPSPTNNAAEPKTVQSKKRKSHGSSVQVSGEGPTNFFTSSLCVFNQNLTTLIVAY